MSLIYYLGVYDSFENESEKRHYSLAATNKMRYIVTAMESKGHTVEVVSPSVTMDSRFYRGKTMPIGERSRVRLFDTFGSRNKLLRVLGRKLTALEYSLYLLTHLKKDDTVLVYHSLGMMNKLRWLKKLCKFRTVMEIEEIYGDAIQNQRLSRREMKYFQLADGYLFPAAQLNDKVNTGNKPYVLIHGTYQVEEDRGCGFHDGKIHCVYAGTLDPRKGGAAMAAEAARYLPETYHLHILGLASAQDLVYMNKLVEELSATCRCGITHDGCLQGEDYIRFLQSCQIGLSTQNPDAAFNDTSFPSKILSYMANGLQVVTVRIPVVEHSAIGKNLYYYEEPTPKRIAEAIRSVPKNAPDCRQTLERLDWCFKQEMEALINEVK